MCSASHNPQNKPIDSLTAIIGRFLSYLFPPSFFPSILFLSFFHYSTMLSVSRLYKIGDRLADEY
jgi:hypothetical protein